MVTFVIPPSPFLLDQKVFMTLGILRVAASVMATSSEPVEAISLEDSRGFTDLADSSSRVYGVTGTTPQAPSILKLAQELPEDSPKVVGGPHATLVGASIKTGSARAVPMMKELTSAYDTVVLGDGELAMAAVVNGSVRGVIDADDPKSEFYVSDVSQLPFPARELLKPDDYVYRIGGVRAGSLIAQLGCPFNCGFCGGRSSAMLRRIRLRSTESVVAEVKHLHQAHGLRAFMFYDDELNVNPKFLELLAALQSLRDELGVEFVFRGFVKAELFNELQAKEMAKAGFQEILSGFESASPKILDVINKKAKVEDNTRVVDLCKSHGIRIKALMSLGHPGESPSTVDDTAQWISRVRPDDFDLTIITPYPGSPYYDKAERQNDGTWRYDRNGSTQFQREMNFHHDEYFYKGIPGEYDSAVWTPDLTGARLVTLRDQLEADLRSELSLAPLTPVAQAFDSSMGQ